MSGKGTWSGKGAVELQRYFHVGVAKQITILKEEQTNYKRNSKKMFHKEGHVYWKYLGNDCER